MPRTYPGGYAQIPYDSFLDQVRASSPEGKSLIVKKESDAPRWDIGQPDDRVVRIEYEVDLHRMEREIRDSVSVSKARSGYVGLLGYSVFAYLDGMEDRAINLEIQAPSAWPVLTTLSPEVPAPLANAKAQAPDYSALADSEILMGPDLQLQRFDGKVPLVLAVYAEAEENTALEGQLAREALDRVQTYFGDTPFQHYTVQLELLKPLPEHEYGFSQEHMDSGTFSLSIARAITVHTSSEERHIALFNYAHHMAHCWIPKRVYGVGYRPFTWEMTPVIDTIWFNEGFGRYAAIEALAAGMPPAEAAAFRERHLSRLRKILGEAPTFLRKMPLLVLSREASFLYADDFRTGMNVFSRGALMAAEMDNRIRENTGGKKSLRDALQFLLRWSEKNNRAFQLDELPQLLSQGASVDVRDIFDRWLKPLVE